jgi:asparagine synthase (glutamine-hydrolysing)
MCGIFGIVGKASEQVSLACTESILHSLRQRGPDDCGIARLDSCVLGHTRLSVIDLSSGKQPMCDSQGNLVITFNGEIYNYRELRKELEGRGHAFLTNSDTEVILNSYAEFGSECPLRLDGMFAFAIWNKKEHSLFLARDRFGKKPLFYAFCEDGTFLFASELKALEVSGQFEPAIDYGSIEQYTRLMYVPPWRTVYSNVCTLPPGHSAIFANGQLTPRTYWNLEYKPIRISYEDAKAEVQQLLLNAVRKRLVADVEVGAFLSGGVDSTVVTYLAQACSDRPIKTFSIGYEDYINELPFAQEAAKRIGTDHYTLQAPATCVDEFLKVTEYFDEPHADSSNVAQYMISNMARKQVKVALCGDGGDEVFLGYEWYWNHHQVPLHERIKKMIFSNPFQEFLDKRLFFSKQEKQRLWIGSPPDSKLEGAIYRNWNSKSTITGRTNTFDLSVYLPGQLLTKADRAGMMCSLEVRAPFMDHTLAQYVYNLPEKYKTDKGSGKLLLRDILSAIMPREFVDRKKQGFGAPVKKWLETGSFKTLVYDLFEGSNARIYQFLDRKFIRELIEEFYVGHRSHQYKIWIILCLELWFRKPRTAVAIGSSDLPC